jgi:hypothetical protein
LKLIEKIDYSDKVYLVPLGDVHLGARGVDLNKLKGYIDWLKETPNSYTFFMGDIFDVATLTSASNPHYSAMNLNEAVRLAYDLFSPIKDKILGGISGNHEARLERFAGFNPLQTFCETLNVPYAGYSAVIRFRVGTLKRKSGMISPLVEYIFFAHHGTGSGTTLGGKLNRAVKLEEVFEGADAYLIGHLHSKALGEKSIAYLSKSGNGKATIKYKRIAFVDSGSFLEYDGSYAEEKMLAPSTTGAVRFRLDGTRKDLHISY